MYYLHLLDGTRHHRDTLIWISQDAAPPRVPHLIGGNPIIDKNGNPQFFDSRWFLGPVESVAEAKTLATTIGERYNYKVFFEGQVMHAGDARLGVHYITSREAQAIVLEAYEDGETVPISSITHACRQGHIRNAKKHGRDWTFRESDFWQWLNNRPKPGPSARK